MATTNPIPALAALINDELSRLGSPQSSGPFIQVLVDAYEVRVRLPLFASATIEHEVIESGNSDEIRRLVRDAVKSLHERTAQYLAENVIP